MPYDYFVRITHPYETLVPLVADWALKCEKMAVYEHVGSATEKVHCHLVIIGSRIQKKQLRNIALLFNIDLKGNEMCSFKECVTPDVPLIYMSKGNLDPKYLKGWEPSEARAWKAKWVAPTKHVKVGGDEMYYNDMVGDWDFRRAFDEDPEFARYQDPQERQRMFFSYLKRRIHALVFQEEKRIWNQRASNRYRMLVLTYCMRNNVSILRDTRWGEWL